MDNKILVRVFKVGAHIVAVYDDASFEIADFKYRVGVPNVSGKFVDIFRKKYSLKTFNTLKEFEDFCYKHKTLVGFSTNPIDQCWERLHSKTDTIGYDRVSVCAYDIETWFDPKVPFRQQRVRPILSIAAAFKDSDGSVKKYQIGLFDDPDTTADVHIKVDSEKHLLEAFFELTRNHKALIVTGWNSNGFDDIVLLERCKALHVDFCSMSYLYEPLLASGIDQNDFLDTPPGIAFVDAMELYKTFTFGGRSSYRLEAIATHEGHKRGKVKYKGTLMDLYEQDKSLFYFYNMEDVELILFINSRCMMFNNMVSMSQSAHINFESVLFQTRYWNRLLDQECIKRNRIPIPAAKHEKDEIFKGAHVYAKPGVYVDVATFDAASLYPNTMIGQNNSPETLIAYEKADYDDPSSVLPTELPESVSKRYWYYFNSLEHDDADFIKALKFSQDLTWNDVINESEDWKLQEEIAYCKTFKTVFNRLPNSFQDLESLNSVIGYHGPWSIGANGTFYRTDVTGIIPYILKNAYSQRKVLKASKLRKKSTAERIRAAVHAAQS